MRLPLLLLSVLLAACGGPPSAPAEPPAPAPRPRLVVAVVVDQLASHALERYLRHLDEDGALRRLARTGAFHPRVEYAYAGTYTAAGHAAIHTGAPPAVSGVYANEVWDRAREREVPIADDGEHPVHGVEGAFASPHALRVETVAEALERATDGRAITASMSIKDRGAIFAAGRSADLALWYDKRLPGFTSSSFYGERPAWLAEWTRRHPTEDLLAPWEPEDPALLARIAGRDDAAGEGDWHGFGVTFPHDPRASTDPFGVARATPRSTEQLLALAEAAVEELGMGEDEVPDLLAISISSTDYVAHTFGPDSWEYVDNLIRCDRALGALLARLERERERIAVLVTADHGGAPLPERTGGGRLMPGELARGLDAALDAELGEGDWVRALVQPFVYLGEATRDDAVRARAAALAVRWLEARPEVALAADVRVALTWRTHEDPLRRAVWLSVPEGAAGDVFVVPAEGYVMDEDMPAGAGTSHGTPWEYDRTVPVLFAGPGVSSVQTTEPLAQDRVAATIAALLGIEPPEAGRRAPLPGTPAR